MKKYTPLLIIVTFVWLIVIFGAVMVSPYMLIGLVPWALVLTWLAWGVRPFRKG